MKLLTVALVWLLTITYTGHRGEAGGGGVWVKNWSFVSWIFHKVDYQLKICLHASKISSFLSIKMLSIFLKPSLMAPVHCYLQGGGGGRFLTRLKNRHFWTHFFLNSTPFRSKLKQDVNISPFLNHFMLKNPRALDTFLHANQMERYTWAKIVNFRNFCLPLSFF